MPKSKEYQWKKGAIARHEQALKDKGYSKITIRINSGLKETFLKYISDNGFSSYEKALENLLNNAWHIWQHILWYIHEVQKEPETKEKTGWKE